MSSLMRIWFGIICALLAASISSCTDRSAHDWLIEPGVRVGPVTARSSEVDLLQLLGKEKVKQSEVHIGEGELVPGTLLYPDDPDKLMEILWKDQGARRNPARIFISGDRSLWHTAEGIRLGTTLIQIEKLNGGPVRMVGFGWDYSGTVVDGAGGKLKFLGTDEGPSRGITGRTLLLRLNPSPSDLEKLASEEYRTVRGDVDLRSDNGVLQKLNPRVYQLLVEFP